MENILDELKRYERVRRPSNLQQIEDYAHEVFSRNVSFNLVKVHQNKIKKDLIILTWL